MPDQSPLTADRVASLMEVLSSPEHRTGLDETMFTVASVTARTVGLTRVTGTISGSHPLGEWAGPNIAVRLSLPEQPAEFAGIDGAPGITARVYTVAEVDPASRVVALDVVVHPHESPVMNWLARTRVGDALPIAGPRPHRVPGPGSPRILLADSSALPAALSILTRMPTDVPTVLAVAAPDDEVDLAEAALANLRDVVSVQRYAPGGDRPLAAAFAAMDVPAGASVWAAGEREDMREVRRRCREDLALAAPGIQVFGYWKRGISNTRIDLARLEAARASMDAGRSLFSTDDLDIDV
ncbi:MAG: SIP domain-containing protein [Rhodococcus sp. (in: high G+C Gram-positive bacteria)]|uniref:siderophore-interacting protein n=1 Tax=Rhodococcus sp. TaxID=1831 RepID=UPI003BB7DFFB